MDKVKYGVRFCTRRPAEQLEAWLRRNCLKSWDIKLSGMVEDRAGNLMKQLTVYFDIERDRKVFETCYFAH